MLSAVVDESAQAEPPGLALVAELRASLLERCSLVAHEVLAPEGVPFSRVRAGCEQALEALERCLRDPHRAPFSSLVLEREVAGCIQGGLSFVALMGALQRAFVELGTQVAGAPSEAAQALLGAAGGVLERVGTAAAAELDTTHRASLRRRAAIADRVRAAASLLAGVALDLDRVLDAISRATAEGLACDWAAVAVREPDGRLVIAASTGVALISATVIVKPRSSLAPALSTTPTVTGYVPGPALSAGVHEKTPVVAPIVAPAGALTRL